MSKHFSSSMTRPSDQKWDAFVASLHLVWTFAPDFSLEGQMNLAGRSVLIVDFDESRNTRLAEQLTRVGLQASPVASVTAAWSLLRYQTFDLILVFADRELGEAQTFCRLVADDPHLAHLAILVLGEEVTLDSIWEWRRAGAKYYLREPYDPYALLTLMSAAVDAKRE